MILKNWLKRIKKGAGFIAFSAESWARVCNVLETIEGVGCSIRKTQSGLGWIIDATGNNADVAGPDGYVTARGLPDGTEIWGRVEYDASAHTLSQYKDVWDVATQSFVESDTATLITDLESHASQH